VLTTLGAVTSYDDTAVSNGTTYFYEVSAVNGVGEGQVSNEVSATPQGATVPGAPVLSASPASGKGVMLSWTSPPNGGSAITGYRIYRSTSAGGEGFLTAVGNVTSYKDTSTKKGTVYYYKVSAVNAVGEGPLSNEASAKAT
jgi:fibronectin type 3 domain-containing protein